MSDVIVLLNDISAKWSPLMLTAIVRGTVALVAAWAFCWTFRRTAPFVRCWIWRVAYAAPLIALLCLFWFAPVPLPVYAAVSADAVHPDTIHPDAVASGSTSAERLPANGRPEAIPAEDRDAETQPVEKAASNPAAVAPSSAAGDLPSVTIGVVLLLGWICGTGVMLIRLARRWCEIRWLMRQLQPASNATAQAMFEQMARRLGLRKTPALRTLSADGLTPFLFGVRKPVVVLRTSMLSNCTAAELETIFAHEMAHCRRRDLIWNWLPAVIEILFFFHPLVWFSRRQWHLAQEMAADELAVNASGVDVDAYAGRLLSIVCKLPPGNVANGFLVAMSRTFQDLSERLTAMTHFRPCSRFRRRTLLLIVTAIGGLGVVPWKPVARAQSKAQNVRRPAKAQPAVSPRKQRQAKAEKVPLEGPNYLIVPFDRARTDLQKSLIGTRMGAEILINGTAIVTDAGTIDGEAIPLSRLRQALQPFADRKRNTLEVHIYHRLVGNSTNAKDLLLFSFQGFGKFAGFQKTRVFNHYQGQRFQFKALIAARKKQIEEGENTDEPLSGNADVKVYPVRTTLSRSKCAGADCVVEIVPRFKKGPQNALPPKIEAAIRRYVSKLKVKRKGKLLFVVTSAGAGRKTVDWFAEQGAPALARALGYKYGLVRHTPY